jgi:hypothetical protein
VPDLFIALIMEAVHTSERSVYYKETEGCNIPEGSNSHTHSHEKLKSHMKIYSFHSDIIIIYSVYLQAADLSNSGCCPAMEHGFLIRRP